MRFGLPSEVEVRPSTAQRFHDSIAQLDKAFGEETRAAAPQVVVDTAAIESVTRAFRRVLLMQEDTVAAIVAAEEKREAEAAERRRLEQERADRERAERERVEKQRQQQEAAAQKKKQEEEERQLQEKQQKQEQEARLLAQQEQERVEREKKQGAGTTNFSAIASAFASYKQDIVDIKNSVGQMDAATKKVANQIKRKINPKFGQLSNSYQQLHKVTNEVVELIHQSKTQGDAVYRFILNFVAKAVVAQAETEVTVKPSAALPLARLTEKLMATFAELEYYLAARFVKKCPYIIGFTCSIDSEEGRVKMGWKRVETKWEQENKYEERVAGICAVWAVLARLPDHKSTTLFTPEAIWQFVARLLNTNFSLISNPHFMVACNWWEAAAAWALHAFGKQGHKLCRALTVDLPQALADKKFPGATALRLLGKEWLEQGSVKSLKEMEP